LQELTKTVPLEYQTSFHHTYIYKKSKQPRRKLLLQRIALRGSTITIVVSLRVHTNQMTIRSSAEAYTIASDQEFLLRF